LLFGIQLKELEISEMLLLRLQVSFCCLCGQGLCRVDKLDLVYCSFICCTSLASFWGDVSFFYCHLSRLFFLINAFFQDINLVLVNLVCLLNCGSLQLPLGFSYALLFIIDDPFAIEFVITDDFCCVRIRICLDKLYGTLSSDGCLFRVFGLRRRANWLFCNTLTHFWDLKSLLCDLWRSRFVLNFCRHSVVSTLSFTGLKFLLYPDNGGLTWTSFFIYSTARTHRFVFRRGLASPQILRLNEVLI